MQKTRFPELLLDRAGAADWRFADAATGAHVGPRYATQGEALADLDRYHAVSWAGGAARPEPLELDGAELGAVLAGLRLLQSYGCPDELEDVATDGGRFDLPSDDFLDALCERLNGSPAPVQADAPDGAPSFALNALERRILAALFVCYVEDDADEAATAEAAGVAIQDVCDLMSRALPVEPPLPIVAREG